MGLGQPDRIQDLAVVTLLAQQAERNRNGLGREKEVQVFGGPPYSRVLLQREGAGDRVGNLMLIE